MIRPKTISRNNGEEKGQKEEQKNGSPGENILIGYNYTFGTEIIIKDKTRHGDITVRSITSFQVI